MRRRLIGSGNLASTLGVQVFNYGEVVVNGSMPRYTTIRYYGEILIRISPFAAKGTIVLSKFFNDVPVYVASNSAYSEAPEFTVEAVEIGEYARFPPNSLSDDYLWPSGKDIIMQRDGGYAWISQYTEYAAAKYKYRVYLLEKPSVYVDVHNLLHNSLWQPDDVNYDARRVEPVRISDDMLIDAHNWNDRL